MVEVGRILSLFGEVAIRATRRSEVGAAKRARVDYSMRRRHEASGDDMSSVGVGPEGFLEGSWGKLTNFCRLAAIKSCEMKRVGRREASVGMI